MSVKTEHLARVKAHRWQVSSLAFREDGLRLASASWDREVHIWDLTNMKSAKTLEELHEVPVTCLGWQTQQPQLLCTGSADKTAVLWNPDTGNPLQTLKHHSGWVLGCSFSSVSALLATASWDQTVCIWDVGTGDLVCSLEGHTAGVWSVDCHPYSPHLLCSSGEDGALRVWDTREGQCVLVLESGNEEVVYCSKWSPDATMIASGSSANQVYLWDISSESLLNTMCNHDDAIRSLAFSTSSSASVPVLASAGGNKVVLADPRPNYGTQLLSIHPKGGESAVDAVEISPEGSILASGERSGHLVLNSLDMPVVKFSVKKDSISDQLRKSGVILDEVDGYGSTESLVESLPSSDIMLASSTTEDLVSLQTNTSDDLVHIQNIPHLFSEGPSGAASEIYFYDDHNEIKPASSRPKARTNPKKAHQLQNARESRKKRAEKKLVDLPTMIAHLSTSARGSVIRELSSSSESSDEDVPESYNGPKLPLSSLINVTHKVSTFSNSENVTVVEDGGAKVPDPRLSLLEEEVPEAIRERRDFFQEKSSNLKSSHVLEDPTPETQPEYYSSKLFGNVQEEIGSGEDSCDDIQLSMI